MPRIAISHGMMLSFASACQAISLTIRKIHEKSFSKKHHVKLHFPFLFERHKTFAGAILLKVMDAIVTKKMSAKASLSEERNGIKTILCDSFGETSTLKVESSRISKMFRDSSRLEVDMETQHCSGTDCVKEENKHKQTNKKTQTNRGTLSETLH